MSKTITKFTKFIKNLKYASGRAKNSQKVIDRLKPKSEKIKFVFVRLVLAAMTANFYKPKFSRFGKLTFATLPAELFLGK